MSRRNLLILIVVALVAAFCHQRVQKNPFVRVLAEAMATVENRALDPVGDQKLFEGAMTGMVEQLDDYSDYISAAQMSEFHETIDGQFGGVGILLGVDPDTKQLKVLSPLAGWAAARAGVLAGDRILRIGEASTQGMSIQDASIRLRGEPGSTVSLTIQHEGQTKPLTVVLDREIIHEDTVLGDTRNADGTWNFWLDVGDRIGYVRIVSFTDDTIIELRDALARLAGGGMRGLVLDLRDNPGGYVDAAVKVCDLFVKSGVIVSTRRREGRVVKTVMAGGDAPYADVPIVVLINQQSASAAEIVAACLQDNRRATVVGQRSYGKGTVQEVIELPQGCGAMKITTASYWRPNGRNIHRSPKATAKDDWGVSPDKGCAVPLDEKEFLRWQAWRARRDVQQAVGEAKTPPGEKPFVDRQLQRAVECVEKNKRAL